MYSILILGPSLAAVSGVSTHLNQLLGSSLNREFRLIHFQVGSEGRDEYYLGKLARFIGSPFLLAWKLFKHRPAVVHLNTSIDIKGFWRDAVYLIVAKFFGRKVIYQLHGGESPEFFFGVSGLLNKFARWLFRLPDAVIVVAEEKLQAYKNFSRFKNLSVIPNAIDLGLYERVEEKSFDSKVLQLGYIGRLAADKGIFQAVESMHVLRQRGFESLRFMIAGSGPDEDAIRERINALELEDMVNIVGPVFGEAKIHFWRHVDILLFPSHHEGLPYAILESLASGTPMVTTCVGGIPDAVIDGIHGFVVKPRDISAIADSIQAMLLDRPRLRRMSVACLQRAKEKYGVERLARQMSDLYMSVLK